MLKVGDRVHDVRVWMAPREPVSIRELAAEKPLLPTCDELIAALSEARRFAKPT